MNKERKHTAISQQLQQFLLTLLTDEIVVTIFSCKYIYIAILKHRSHFVNYSVIPVAGV